MPQPVRSMKKYGFALEAEKPVKSFGCDLIEQTYKIVF